VLKVIITVKPFFVFLSGRLQWISVPFALTNPAVSDITITAVKQVYQSPWRGSIHKGDTWVWIDNFCLLVPSPCVIHPSHHQNVVHCDQQGLKVDEIIISMLGPFLNKCVSVNFMK